MDYLYKFEIVKKHIDALDPENLLAIGAPDDEYDLEIADIAWRIKNTMQTNEAADLIRRVFVKYFNRTLPVKAFYSTAEAILNDLNK